MRFISYRTEDDGEGVGVRSGTDYRGLAASKIGGNLRDFLASSARLDELGRQLAIAPLLDMEKVQLLPPISRPEKIICIGLNYADHSAESGFSTPSYPAVFARFANSLIAAGDPLIRPSASKLLDYEGELAVVIGTGGRHITENEALSHLAGYSIFNDGSIRDFQMKSTQWTMGKSFDGTGAFGPELVTPDELPPGAQGLAIRTIVNGQVLQEANTRDLIFSVARLVAILSEGMTLSPGDVIATGTPAGVGALRDPQIWLQPGDECVVEVEQIGKLTNPIIQEAS